MDEDRKSLKCYWCEKEILTGDFCSEECRTVWDYKHESDDPTEQIPSAQNLASLFPFNFGWKIDNKTLVLTFMDQDRALKALNCLQELKHMNSPVKAVVCRP